MSNASMALKRKARDAFEKPKAQLSAFAALRQSRQNPPQPDVDTEFRSDETNTLMTDAPFPEQAPFDEYEATLFDNNTPTAVETSIKAPPLKLSTFAPDEANARRDDETTLELVLRASETLTIIGEYDVQVLTGRCTVYGTLLYPELSPQRVYAPSVQALPPIVSLEEGTLIRITSKKSGLQQLELLAPMFRNIWALDEAKSRSFVPLSSSADDVLQRLLNPLDVDDASKNVLSRLTTRYGDGGGRSSDARPIIMAIGSKSAGKSTFNRLLCNTIHSRWSAKSCLYLDLDPGQPEFGPPGQVSLVEVRAPLLGPAFSHPADRSSPTYNLIRSHTLAAMSFKDDHNHYVACAIDLFRHASSNEDIRSLPIVVNSCGWVSSLGAAVITRLTQQLRVTDIVQLGPVDQDLLNSFECAIHAIPRRTIRPSPRGPAEARAMQTMAYFHHESRESGKLKIRRDKSISSFLPWEVTYKADSSGISAILSYGRYPDPTFLAEILEMAVVAIVAVDPDLLDDAIIARTSTEDLPYVEPMRGISFILDPQRSQCIGLALIRKIDVFSKTIHLITPLPDSQVASLGKQKIVLVRGAFDSPDWCYQEDMCYEEAMESIDPLDNMERPYVSRKDEGAVWRVRHPPRPSAIHR